MPTPAPEAHAKSSALYVTRNFWPVAIFAALLLFFGFYWFQGPSGSGVFLLGDTIFQYTLRIGGIVMAVLALLSLTGKLGVLALDGVGSAVIGVLLIISALLMMAGGDRSINQFIYMICGAMTISSGLRNWRDYRVLSGVGGASCTPPGAGYDPNFAQDYEQARSEPPGPSLASQLHERAQQAAAGEAGSPAKSPPVVSPLGESAEVASGTGAERPVPQDSGEHTPVSPPVMAEDEASGTPGAEEAPTSAEQDDTEPPDGFLAGFADEGPPRQP